MDVGGPSDARLARVTTGIAGLDEMLDGGLLSGGVYLLVGPAGAGKTVFVNQVAFHHAAQDGRVAYFTVFGETNTRLLGHVRQFSFFHQEAVGTGIQYLSGYSDVHSGGLSVFRQTLERQIRTQRVSLLIVDGLPVDVGQVGGSSLRETYDFYHNLQALCEATQCTTLVSIPSTGNIWEHYAFLFVDGVFELSRSVHQAVVVRSLEIRKFRGSTYRAASHPFMLTLEGVTMLP